MTAQNEKRAAFTLSIENDTFSDLDLMKFAEIMQNMAKTVGEKSRLVKFTDTRMIFEEEKVGAWRILTANLPTSLDVYEADEELEDLSDDELYEILQPMVQVKNVEDYAAWFANWDREGLLALHRLINQQKDRIENPN